MKKLFVAVLLSAISISSYAQFSSGGFSLSENSLYWGARFGVTGAKLTGNLDLGMKAGMTLAGVVGIRLSESTPVFLESGLYYTERGGKKNKRSVSYNGLEIPLLVKYGFQVDEFAILPFLGPYFSYAVSGKAKIAGEGGKTVYVGAFDEKKWTGLKRANMGFKVGVGAEYNKLYLEVGYQLGVTDISKNGNNEAINGKVDDISIKSNAFFMNFGVNF